MEEGRNVPFSSFFLYAGLVAWNPLTTTQAAETGVKKEACLKSVKEIQKCIFYAINFER